MCYEGCVDEADWELVGDDTLEIKPGSMFTIDLLPGILNVIISMLPLPVAEQIECVLLDQ